VSILTKNQVDWVDSSLQPFLATVRKLNGAGQGLQYHQNLPVMEY